MPSKTRRSPRRNDTTAARDFHKKDQADADSQSGTSYSTEYEDSDNGSNTSRKSQRPHRKAQGVPVSQFSMSSPPETKKKPMSRDGVPGSLRPHAKPISTANVYAGPIFNNAPAPSTLPLPIDLGIARTIPSAVPTAKPVHAANDDVNFYWQQSQDLMQMLSVAHPFIHHSTMSSNHGTVHTNQTISDIQRGLRSILNIEA